MPEEKAKQLNKESQGWKQEENMTDVGAHGDVHTAITNVVAAEERSSETFIPVS